MFGQNYNPGGPGFVGSSGTHPGSGQQAPQNSYQDQLRRLMEMLGGSQDPTGRGFMPSGIGGGRGATGRGGGIVGAPDLGTVAGLMMFQNQGGGPLPPGLQPSIGQFRQQGGVSGPMGKQGMFGNIQSGGGGTPVTQQSLYNMANAPNSPFGPSRTPSIGGLPLPSPQLPGMGQLPFGGQGTGGGVPWGAQGHGGLGGNLERTIGSMLGGGSGFNPQQEQQLRTQAGDYAAGQQRMAEQRLREDAIRRGASTSAGGDTDIRSELNRVGFEGAAGQQRATQDVDRMLAQLGQQRQQAGLGAGVSLYREQGERERALRELELLLSQLQSEQGMQGLNFILGGR